MERMWNPWRMEYVGSKYPEDGECLFCQAGREPEQESFHVLYHNEQALAMMNKYPYSNGHFMVVPKRHLSQVEELSPAERLAIMNFLAWGSIVLKEALSADGINAGFNLGRVAGAGLPGHLHLHLVPRWANDVNFMTILADVRNIPEHLEVTYHKLKTHFARLGAQEQFRDGVC